MHTEELFIDQRGYWEGAEGTRAGFVHRFRVFVCRPGYLSTTTKEMQMVEGLDFNLVE